MKHLFSTALSASPLHFAAHSHHLWPDASKTGQEECWNDAATLSDNKWDKVFAEIIPAVQKHIAGHLNLSNPGNIAFATNTHEFVNRLLSCLPEKPHILTTDSEFHSFSRQIARLEEDNLIRVTRIPTMPFESFTTRFTAAAHAAQHDMVFFSHVFFNSGYAIPDLKTVVDCISNPDTIIVIDGYHGFMAVPTDLSGVESRVFYLAGGYKYAMSGEGCCFMHCPADYAPRPRNTGWFADMGALAAKQGGVNYAQNGFRFWGATFDPSGLYRMKAVMEMLLDHDLCVDEMHAHVLGLQDYFLKSMPHAPGTLITPVDTHLRGRFLTFETENAAAIHDELQTRKIITDHRGSRLRFGFGIYHDRADIDRLIAALLECDFVKAA